MQKLSQFQNEQCPACTSNKLKQLVAMSEQEFLRCRTCRLEFVWPQPAATSLQSEYQEFYAGQRVTDNFGEMTQLAMPILQMDLALALDARNPGQLKFLDVGCGGGHFVKAAEILGMESFGLEVDLPAVQASQARGLQVYYGELPHPKLIAKSFDVIKAMHVLEHIAAPGSFLMEVHRLLHPEGVLWIDVPNQASLFARFKKILFSLKLGDFGYLQPPLHLTAFNQESLIAVLQRTGFEVKRVLRSSPIDRQTYPYLEMIYTQSRKYRVARRLYQLAWLLGDSPYLSVLATPQ